MLFLGHFSFDERQDDGRFGHFTCVVEAKTTGAAEKAFNELIRSMKREKKLFTGTVGVPISIYLDSLNVIADVPSSGVISWYSSYGPDGLGSISTALPHADVGGCKGYFYHPSDRPDIAEKVESGEQHEAVPFLSFEPTPSEKRMAELKETMERQAQQQAALAQRRKPFSKKSWYE
jgi:uncharacterized protein with LGFP repeats